MSTALYVFGTIMLALGFMSIMIVLAQRHGRAEAEREDAEAEAAAKARADGIMAVRPLRPELVERLRAGGF